MAYKRRRTNNPSSSAASATRTQASSRSGSSSRQQPFSRVSSIARSLPPSTPSLPSVPCSKRVSLGPPSSQGTVASAYRDQDVVRADDPETVAEIEERENADAMNETIMAIYMRDRGTIGCAYYIAREEKLYLMQDMQLSGLEIIDTLKLHAQPTLILISTRADEKLEDHLSKDARGIDRQEEGSNDVLGSYVLDSRASTEFRYDVSLNKLINLDLLSDRASSMVFATPGDDPVANDAYEQGAVTGRQGRLMRLASYIDIDSNLTIGCAGAVLAHILRRKGVDCVANDSDGPATFQIRKLEMFTLSDLIFVNADTLASLQIIQTESHPNSHMQGPSASGAKESLSVFGLFVGQASTPQGKQKLRQIFLRPSADITVIEERLHSITTLLRPENSSALTLIAKSLRKIKNIRTVVVHLQKGINIGKGGAIKKGAWASLQAFIFYTLKVLEGVRDLPIDRKTLEIATKLLANIDVLQLDEIGKIITSVIDFPRSEEQHRTVILQGVDPELDNIKRAYDGMDSLLTNVARKLSSDVPEWAAGYIENCIYYPQLGFLTVVPLDPSTGKGKYEGEGMEDDVWNKIFTSNDMGYFKNRHMKEMDAYFGDMYSMICDREIDIAHGLALKVLVYENTLISASDLCGELDSLVALALGAQKYRFNPPRMTTANIINIEGGRHPLQEHTVLNYVPNDCFLAGGTGDDDATRTGMSSGIEKYDRNPTVLIMTGPNYSGKSIYLKQNALIVYMAHIGSFVPAEKATIGITDKILTRIATRESVSRNQSAFMIDLQQVALSMTLATRRTLVVIDEFGKGTNSLDGAGLATGVFEYFLSLGPHSPKVLGATHFHEIFETGFLKERPRLGFGHMEVRVDHDTDIREDQVTYLYNFVPGRSTSSFGTTCALLNGIDLNIVARAEELILLAARGEDLVKACSKVEIGQVPSLQDAEQVGRQFLEYDFDNNGAVDAHAILKDVLKVNSNQ